jgi:hypothetical protein
MQVGKLRAALAETSERAQAPRDAGALSNVSYQTRPAARSLLPGFVRVRHCLALPCLALPCLASPCLAPHCLLSPPPSSAYGRRQRKPTFSSAHSSSTALAVRYERT